MNTAISIIRISILLSIGFLAFLLIFSTEEDHSLLPFLLHVILDKGAGFLLILAFVRLYRRWSRSDRWIARYDEWNTSKKFE